ncbi:hypothetical protein EA655_05575 [Pseudoxanthomonas winnipegensis]|uniref:Uncharacterized protein n=2 Tax=Pseudoxanthomonas winnipegensis TaxID=2480810 RepID=A0A4Q8M9K1_9GAMM|nr:hypothetical protein EA655_05575 [Pseudoxanthomonas winnipegensis]
MMLLSAMAALIISGCASVKYNGPGAKTELVDFPPVGQVTTAQVGDYLVRKGVNVQEQALVVKAPVDWMSYDIPAGTYRQIGDDAKLWYYSPVGTGGAVRAGVLADPYRALAVEKKAAGEICVITVFNAKSCGKGSFERRTVASTQAQGFQQTLLYNGRVGDKINIGYREFSNDMARPAFSNEVEYDLKASTVIGYKGAQIEVLDANNSSITYRVLKPFPASPGAP